MGGRGALPTKSLVISSRAENPTRNLLFVGSEARNDMAFRSGLKNAGIPAHAEAEDRKLRKDPAFGGSLL